MAIHVRRYHLALVVLFFAALSGVGVWTLQREQREAKVEGALPPMQEIKPEASSRSPKTPAKPAPKSPAAMARPPGGAGRPAPVVSKPAPGAVKRIALTFDDGPHPGYTDRLIQILEENGVRATFFVVGKQAALHPNLIEKIFQAGHELANHSYTHRDLRTLTDRDVADELDRTHRLVESITDQKMKFFRPPGGQYNDGVVREASNLNYTMALWTVLPQDHAHPSSRDIVERVVKGAGADGIVLLHSGVENTLAALPELISALKEQGYFFVTLSELSTAASPPSLVRLPK